MPGREPTFDARIELVVGWASRRGRVLALALGGAGIVLRVVQYLWRTSYSHDEAMLVSNVMGKGMWKLVASHLDHNQAAPPGFLLMERGVALMLGWSEYSLRLLPLLLSVASVVLFVAVARRFLSGVALVFACACFAFSERLIWHAAETKQYDGDIFSGLLLLWLAMGIGRRMSATRRLYWVGIVGAVLIWFSHAALFVIGGIWVVTLPRFMRMGFRGAVRYVACALPVAVSFAVLFWFSIRVQRDEYLNAYWAHYFVPWGAWWRIPRWVGVQTVELFDYPLRPFGVVLLPLAILGVAWGRWTRKAGFGWLIWPIVLDLIAAGLHEYPYGGSRTTVYLAPAVFVLAGVGIAALGDELRKGWRWLYWGMTAGIVAVSMFIAVERLAFPRYESNIRPVADYVGRHYRPGDMIYALDFTSVGDCPGDGRACEFQCYWHGRSAVKNIIPRQASLLPRGRVWVTYAYCSKHQQAKLEPVLQELREQGFAIDEFHVVGGEAFLFQLNQTENVAGYQREVFKERSLWLPMVAGGDELADQAAPIRSALSRLQGPGNTNETIARRIERSEWPTNMSTSVGMYGTITGKASLRPFGSVNCKEGSAPAASTAGRLNPLAMPVRPARNVSTGGKSGRRAMAAFVIELMLMHSSPRAQLAKTRFQK